MTGQPRNEDEMATNTQRANAEISEMLENGEIERGFDEDDDMPEADSLEEYREKKAQERNEDEKSDEEKLAELREFKENSDAFDEVEEIAEENEQATVEDYDMVRNKNKDETEMHVTENGDVETFTRDEWENERSARTRVWDRLERNGGVYVRIAHWFKDADVNKVKTGKGFYGKKTDETDKAYQFEVQPGNENHNAETERVWVPKKAAQVYELKE